MKDYISTLSENEVSSRSHAVAGEPSADDVRSSSGGEPLPCLFSNISIESVIKSTQHRKSANALSWNVQYFADRFGLENLAFLTNTFADHVVCIKEAQRRFNSLLSNVIKPRYSEYIGVVERQKSGRVHFHTLLNVGKDIRTGVDFSEFEQGVYTSASDYLRSEWSYWRDTAPKYRFGRTEMLPIRSSSEAIGRYVGKYIGKHMDSRNPEDKNARLVRYSRGARTVSTRFMFLSEGSSEWRAKVCAFAHYVSARTGCEPTMEGLRHELGPRWAHTHRDFISSLPVLGT